MQSGKRMDKSKTIRVEKNIYNRGPHTYQVKMRDGFNGWIIQTFFDVKSDSVALQKARDFRDLKRISKNNDQDYKRIEASSANKRILSITFGDLLRQYKNEVTVNKKDVRTEGLRIDMLLRLPIAKLPANRVDGDVVRKQLLQMTFRNQGKKPISDSTKVRYQALISHVYKVARTRWRHSLDNPIQDTEKFTNNKGRDRRLYSDEYEYIRKQLENSNPELKIIFILALASGMRQSEIINISWEDIDWEHNSILVDREMAKNGLERTIPIFKQEAIDVLKKFHINSDKPKHGNIFTMSQNAVIQGFRKAIERARGLYVDECLTLEVKPSAKFLINLKFHDLRHEAASYLFENTDLKDLEIMAILGHQDLQTTKRYAHLRSKSLGKKIIEFNKNS